MWLERVSIGEMETMPDLGVQSLLVPAVQQTVAMSALLEQSIGTGVDAV